MDDFWWPTTYFDSRRRFVEQATTCGASVQACAHKAAGPNGEHLTTEVATFISETDRHRIIVVSGVHGVEGFIGAGVQYQALNTLLTNARPDGVGVIMIHAVNPWGFSHLRRVDENNIDVNRNFFDLSISTPASHSHYPALDPVINPKYAPSLSGEIQYWSRATHLIARNGGIQRLARPIAEGQCDYPKGLFYSGIENGASSLLLQQLLCEHTATVESTTILDIHSGLGSSGKATLIGNTNQVDKNKQLDWLKDRYSQPIVMDNISSNAYNAQGSLSQWCSQAFSDKQFLYLCVEIGTVNPITLFSALRRENQAHHWAEHGDKAYNRTKQKLLDVFAPPSLAWRHKAISEGLQVFESTLTLTQIE